MASNEASIGHQHEDKFRSKRKQPITEDSTMTTKKFKSGDIKVRPIAKAAQYTEI